MGAKSGTAKPGAMNGADGMGAMMRGIMGGSPQKELYPSLMALPILSLEQRLHLQREAEARATTGKALLLQGTVRMANTAAKAGAAVDRERGWIDDDGRAVGFGETLGGMAYQLRTEILGPTGRDNQP